MGFFNKRKNKTKQPGNNATAKAYPPTPYYDALSKALGTAQIRQLAFGDIIAGAAQWDVDMQKGTITFGETSFPVLFLGSESSGSGTWLWGWKNINGYPDAVWKETESIYGQLMSRQMNEIKDVELPLMELVNGHAIASLAVTCGSGMCYYKAPYNGGAAFLLIKNVPATVFTSITAERAAKCINNVIASFPINHRLMVGGIVGAYSKNTEENAGCATMRFPDGSSLTVHFDGQGRISNIRL